MAGMVLDLAILQAFARSELLALTAAPVASWWRVSSRRMRSSASLRRGAASAMASSATSDNEYYVNLLPDPSPLNKKVARPPAEWGPGLRGETDCIPPKLVTARHRLHRPGCRCWNSCGPRRRWRQDARPRSKPVRNAARYSWDSIAVAAERCNSDSIAAERW